MKKFLIAIFAVTFLITGCGDSPNVEKLVMGFDESPLGYRNEKGEIVGFEIDLAKEVAKRMKVNLEFKIIDWNNKEEELNSGNIDMIFNGLDITPERKEIMLFSRSYMDNRKVITVLKGNPHSILSEFDLKGKRLAVKAGTTSEFYVNNHDKLKDNLKVFMSCQSDKDCFDALDKDIVDAVLSDEIITRYEMSKRPDHFEVIEATIGSVNEYGVAFRKNDVELRDRFQEAFDAIVKDGTAKDISEKWFGADLIKRR